MTSKYLACIPFLSLRHLTCLIASLWIYNIAFMVKIISTQRGCDYLCSISYATWNLYIKHTMLIEERLSRQEPTTASYTNSIAYRICNFATSYVRWSYHAASQPVYTPGEGVDLFHLIFGSRVQLTQKYDPIRSNVL